MEELGGHWKLVAPARRRLGAAVGRRRRGDAARLLGATGARPRLELTVGVEEDAEYLRNQHARVHSFAVNVLAVLRVALKAGLHGALHLAKHHEVVEGVATSGST